jgi:hypothetical protein
MWWLLALSLSFASDVCEDTRPLKEGVTSIAWVTPVGQRARANTWLTVIPTARLREWMTRHEAQLPRLLQGLGRRRKATTPRHDWKVTIFEVDSGMLCRPVEEGEPGTLVSGLPICPRNQRTVSGRHDGCGYATDLAYQTRGPELLGIQWRDAVKRGFCVLPASRFIDGR